MAIIIHTIFEKLEKEAISTELIQLPDVHIKPFRITQGKDCLACMGKDNCVFKDDDFYEIFEKIKEADGLILGSPVYGVDISAEMKIFLDRLGLASIGNPDALRHKPGAAVCAVRRAGGMNTLVVVFSLKGIFLCCAALISKNVLSHLIFISIQVI